MLTAAILSTVNEGASAGAGEDNHLNRMDTINGRRPEMSYEQIVTACLLEDETVALDNSNLVGDAATPTTVLDHLESSNGSYRGLPRSKELNLSVTTSMFRTIRLCQVSRSLSHLLPSCLLSQ